MVMRYVSIIVCLFLMGAVSIFPGCGGEPEEPELVISDQEFEIFQEGRYIYGVKVTGTIRNAGNVDVSDVVLTGECPSCSTSIRDQQWFLMELKRDAQKDFIRFLGQGEREDFEFEGLAYFRTGGGDPPEEMPDDVSAYVESYEVE